MMQNSDHFREYLPRHLFKHDEKGKLFEIDEATLLSRSRPIVVLGEPGMGKTWLLKQFAKQPNMEFIRAGALVRNPLRPKTKDPSKTLVIDALDEVAALQEGDPLHNTLKALGEIGYPPFIMSCRAADWRSVLDSTDIAEDYRTKPEVWTLEPISSEEAVALLEKRVGNHERASKLVEQIENKNLADLLGNPLTLNLLAEVFSKRENSLPESRADLFAQAIDVLRREPNLRNSGSGFAQLSEGNALSAAGAAMAALVLTGKDAIIEHEDSNLEDNYLQIAEVADLPNGADVKAVLNSRLFRTEEPGERQFVPIHRTIAEYLGARWLASQLRKNGRAKARLFALMSADGLVPASLRGLHAWLAHWDDDLANSVIANDPYGLLRYGDADNLSVDQSKKMVAALRRLDEENPYFRAGDWSNFSAAALTRPELEGDLRTAITKASTGYQLRSLLLEAMHGTEIAILLAADLLMILRDTSCTYVERIRAGEALVMAAEDCPDWPRVIHELCQEADEDSPRLAVNIVLEIGVSEFSEELIVETVLAELGYLDSSSKKQKRMVGGTLYRLAPVVPDERIRPILDCLIEGIAKYKSELEVKQDDWEAGYELSQFSQRLIIQLMEVGTVEPLRLWCWLDVLSSHDRSRKKDLDYIAEYFQTHTTARRAIQAHLLFSDKEDEDHIGIFYGMSGVSYGLQLQEEDIPFHLKTIYDRRPKDRRFRDAWRILVRAATTKNGLANKIRAIAEKYAAGDEELTKFLDPKPTPQDLEWQERKKKWEAKRQQKEHERRKRIEEQRIDYTAHIEEMRAGALGWINGPAKAYFGQFGDIDSEKEPPDRIGKWLGPELQEAALIGFEATLFRDDLPTPKQVAESYAQDKFWHYIHPIMAGLAERWKAGRGFADVPCDVVLTGCIGFACDSGDQGSSLEGFHQALEDKLLCTPNVFENYLRTWLESHLTNDQKHIRGLYRFAREIRFRPISTKLSSEWLERFPNLRPETEHELVYCLTTAPGGEQGDAWKALSKIAAKRLESANLAKERQHLWLSVCFLVDFDRFSKLRNFDVIQDPNFIWSIRSIINFDYWGKEELLPVTERQLGWIIRSFRIARPQTDMPQGTSSGNTNPFNATEFLESTILTLADDTSDEAVHLLANLINEDGDSYTTQLKAAGAKQRRLRMEAAFQPPNLSQITAALKDETPTTAGEVQAVVLGAISDLQKKLTGNATDTVDNFYDPAGNPHTENVCRNLFLDLLDLPYGIKSSPEEAMPKGSRADAGFRLGKIKVPLEAKGQWHKHVWDAAENQLGRLYTKDYQANGRGIYLVFWFGRKTVAGKHVRRPPGNHKSPETPEQMQTILEQQVPRGLRDLIKVIVLDLSRES